MTQARGNSGLSPSVGFSVTKPPANPAPVGRFQVSSQHPYAEQYIGRPHVMTVDFNNSQEFDSAIREIMRTKVHTHTHTHWSTL